MWDLPRDCQRQITGGLVNIVTVKGTGIGFFTSLQIMYKIKLLLKPKFDLCNLAYNDVEVTSNLFCKSSHMEGFWDKPFCIHPQIRL